MTRIGAGIRIRVIGEIRGQNGLTISRNSKATKPGNWLQPRRSPNSFVIANPTPNGQLPPTHGPPPPESPPFHRDTDRPLFFPCRDGASSEPTNSHRPRSSPTQRQKHWRLVVSPEAIPR